MPWYYEGPESKPVGPVSLDELHARRLNGTFSPEAYVIEHTGQPGESPTWKRYSELFPVSTNLPFLPPVPPVPLPVARPPAPPHPLFPSAAPVPGMLPVPHPLFPSAGVAPLAPPTPPPPSTTTSPHYYPVKKTNAWCAWGLGLGVVAFLLSFGYGIGLLLALPALFVCIVGLMQVQKNREQAGQRRAVVGLILAGVALLISLTFILVFSIKFAREYGQTTTEQTSNNSE